MSTLVKNTFLLTIASIGQKAIAFVYFAFIARSLGDESLLGAYFLALALTMTMGVVNDGGLTSVVIRDVAKNPDRALELVKNALAWKLLLAPVAIAFACFFAPVFHFSTLATQLVYIAVFVMVADALSVMFYGVLRGLHVVTYEALGLLIGQTITVAFGVGIFAFHLFDLRLLVVALLFGSVWNAFFSAYHVGRRLGFRSLIPSLRLGFLPLRWGSMFFLAAIFVKLYSYIDSFTIHLLVGEGAVGVYSIAYKFAYAFQFLPLAFVGALFPIMSSQLQDTVQLKRTLLQAEWYVALLAAPVVFGLSALAPEVIGLVYGDTFLPAAPALQALLVGLWFIFMDFPLGSLLNASGMQHKKTLTMGLAMVVNFFANIIFVRLFGITGAGFAAILTFISLFSTSFYFSRQVISLTLREWWRSVGGITFAGISMFFVVFLVKFPLQQIHPYGWIAAVPLGALVFLLFGWKFGGITKDHVSVVTGILRRKKYAADSSSHS